jgi:iron complex transport system ATP-binding protein
VGTLEGRGARPAVILQVHDLVCRYGAVAALDGVTLTVPPGAFLGILGPNASGKSTLLRALNGLLRPVGGAVYLDGREVGRLGAATVAREVAAVPQEGRSGFGFTAYEVALLGRTPYLSRWGGEGPEDRRAICEAMERTRTLALADRPFDGLSGGERQRVIIARALAQRPRVLLLDEPTLHLDLRSQVEIMDLLCELHRAGLTILVVLHDLTLASLWCERLVLLREGRIAAAGSPEEVLRSDLLREVYAVDLAVVAHPLTGRPVVLPRGHAAFHAEDRVPEDRARGT